MFTRDYKFAHQGIHVVEYPKGSTTDDKTVIARARKDGAWAEGRETKPVEPEVPAEPAIEAPAIEPPAPVPPAAKSAKKGGRK